MRSIKHVVILEENVKLGCNFKLLKKSVIKFSSNNIYFSVHSSINTTESLLQEVKLKACVITFYNGDTHEDFLNQANKITNHGEKIAWLIILLSGEDNILDTLHLADFGLDADVIIAVGTMWARPSADRQILGNVNTDLNKTKSEDNDNCIKEQSEERAFLFTPFINNNSQSYEMKNFCSGNTTYPSSYCMLQIYKIRKSYNNSLVVCFLGLWTLKNGTANLKPFLHTEKRNNLYKFPLIIGEKNSSDALASENVIEDDSDDADMQEFVKYFSAILNASERIITYSKLGNKNADGVWSDLFGATINEEIDIALDSIIKTPERYRDMAFSHNIMESRRSIYIEPKQSNELRDIFLIPFSSKLILCVVGTCAILAVVMTTYKKIMKAFKTTEIKNKDTGLLDSFVWSIGIVTQQGSIWKPGSSAEQIIIIVYLIFTLIIYNSYSAFITSVLSIKLTNIRTVDDLLDSDYEIGYVKNSQDENYLRSMNITQLNEIYLRGYLHNNISSITEGLLKAAKGKYGFFASSHVARRELLIISNYKCKYDIAEITIKDTVNYIAFPMSKRSSYRKLINLSIIKMYESGVYKRIHSLLFPELKVCEKPVTYQSARLPDLTSAFAVLFLGIISGVIIIIGECFWKRKRSLYFFLRKSLFHHRPT
ncbi:glutamate receptor U1-like [Anoplophora glabripennis]|uniref:glutamate receptor U1-like n=1 Tax=Anoplophora glabripennis TaxID=217634 RepID=UPI000C77D6FA|nr:glutamate receptor U1-like [Anoplophora glabripennis]